MDVWVYPSSFEVHDRVAMPSSCSRSPEEPQERTVSGSLTSLAHAGHRREPGAGGSTGCHVAAGDLGEATKLFSISHLRGRNGVKLCLPPLSTSPGCRKGGSIEVPDMCSTKPEFTEALNNLHSEPQVATLMPASPAHLQR